MTKPKYSIYQVETKNGKSTTTIVSKELMYKSDAELACNFKNANDQVRTADYELWWGVMEHDSIQKLIEKEGK